MDKEEAQQILDRQTKVHREKTFQQLAALVGSEEIYTLTGPSGVEYQIEVQAFWDSPKKPRENLRVILSIDDGGFLSSLKPMSSDFIMAPDGSFIGE
jgi:hypothetical protein